MLQILINGLLAVEIYCELSFLELGLVSGVRLVVIPQPGCEQLTKLPMNPGGEEDCSHLFQSFSN